MWLDVLKTFIESDEKHELMMILHDMIICYLLFINEIDVLIKTSAYQKISSQNITEAQWSRIHEFFITNSFRRKSFDVFVEN